MPHGIAVQGHGSGAVVGARPDRHADRDPQEAAPTRSSAPFPATRAAGMKGTLTVR